QNDSAATVFRVDNSGNTYISANDSSQAAPRIIGWENLSAGEAVRLEIGDNANGFQGGFDLSTDFYSYNTIRMIGGREVGTGNPVFVANEGIGFHVINTVADSEAMVVSGGPSQTADLAQWRPSGLAAVASIDIAGNIFSDGFFETGEIGTPSTPSSGFGRFYAKTDGDPYFLNDAGTETNLITPGASGFSGYSGPTGTSGFSGYSGPAGTGTALSGFSGQSGFSGYSGPTGTSGFSGPQGGGGQSNGYGEFYMQGNATSTPLATDTWTLISGTTSAGILEQYSHTTPGKLTYDGSETKDFLINATISMTGGVDDVYHFSAYKNGSIVAKTEIVRKNGKSGDAGNAGLTALVSMSTDDYLELAVKNVKGRIQA
ncbi:unnamed protein product, partial [marine sediment metagenome]